MNHSVIRTAAILVALAAPYCAQAAQAPDRLQIIGTAHYDDGSPIAGANVLLLEGTAATGEDLPSFVPFARGVSDAQGAFRLSVERKRAVIVELIRDKCDWFSVRASLDERELETRDSMPVELISRHDVCR